MTGIANMLVQIKNAQAVSAPDLTLPFSKLRLATANILQANGFLKAVERKKKLVNKTERDWLSLQLRYEQGEGVVRGIKLISRPSRRVYSPKDQLYPVKNGLGIAVISTSRGLMTGEAARRAGLGGEVLFEIW